MKTPYSLSTEVLIASGSSACPHDSSKVFQNYFVHETLCFKHRYIYRIASFDRICLLASVATLSKNPVAMSLMIIDLPTHTSRMTKLIPAGVGLLIRRNVRKRGTSRQSENYFSTFLYISINLTSSPFFIVLCPITGLYQ